MTVEGSLTGRGLSEVLPALGSEGRTGILTIQGSQEIIALPVSCISAMVRFCLALCSELMKLGIRMTAMMPMIATTTSSSISVKPERR